MILLVGNRKGGCGKSTIAVNLAAKAAKSLKGTLVILDADRQETAANWTEERDENPDNLPYIPIVQKYGKIKNTIIELAKKYDHVIIDVAGRNSDEMRSAMTVADTMLMPFKPSNSDFRTIPDMLSALEDVSDINPKLRAIAMLNMCNPSVTNKHENRQWREVLEQISEFKVGPNIYDRKVYRDCLITGEGACEMGNKTAKLEIDLLFETVFE